MNECSLRQQHHASASECRVCIHKQAHCTGFSLVGLVLCYSFQHFTFGIGYTNRASTGLVEGLAQAGSGTAELVKEGEGVQHKVM